MIKLWELSNGGVVIVMVPHCILNGVKGSEDIGKESKGGDRAKPL